MKEKLFHPKLQLLVRIVLGGILVYASWHKIADPPDFAKIIYNYRLFPPASIHMLAVFVPWIELVAGLALISGIGLRGGSLPAHDRRRAGRSGKGHSRAGVCGSDGNGDEPCRGREGP